MRARQDYLPKERIENYLNINPSSSLSSLVPRGMTEDELTVELTDKFANVSVGSNKLWRWAKLNDITAKNSKILFNIKSFSVFFFAAYKSTVRNIPEGHIIAFTRI